MVQRHKTTPTLTSSLGNGRTVALSERDFNDDGAFNIFQAHSNLDYRESTLSSGFAHTCAILDNGAVSCWGRGDAGQQGNGWSDKTTPTLAPSQRCCVVLGARKLDWVMEEHRTKTRPSPAA